MKACPKHTSYDGLEVTRTGPCDEGCGTDPVKPKIDDASFLIVWAYLMVVAIALAPVIAFAVFGVDPSL